MKKVIHCLNFFMPQQTAGTEVYVLALCKVLKKLNYQSKVLIPNYGSAKNERYFFEGIEVIKYAETSTVDRELIMGKRVPEGLPFFLKEIAIEQPDIIHFHELGGSNGITLHHIKAAKAVGLKTIFTFHLAGYSCKTGNLMYKDEGYCDGIIDIKKCSFCSLTVKNNNTYISKLLNAAGMLNYSIGFDTTSFNSSLGTALGYPFLIHKLKNDLGELANSCNALVSLTNWYYDILIKNQIESKKITIIKQGLVNQEMKENLSIHKTDLPLKLVFVGRISSYKGIHLLLEAINDFPQNLITLDIYGKDEDDAYSLSCRTKSAHLLNVHWKGLINPNVVVSKLTQYDLLCLPSTFSEMSPLVIQEAFAAGIPVLASDVYGNAEQITDKVNGWLFKFKSSIDLQKKLGLLLQQPELIDKAKKNIPAIRSFDTIALAYKKVYEEILQPL